MTLPTECRIQSDPQNLHGLSELYYSGFYLDCGSPVMPDPLVGEVHELVLLRRKSRAMVPSSSITLDMGLGKPLAVILSEFLSGYQCDVIHKP